MSLTEKKRCQELGEWHLLAFAGAVTQENEDRFSAHLLVCRECRYFTELFVDKSSEVLDEPEPLVHLRIRKPYLNAWLAAKLPFEILETVDDHVSECAVCGEYVEQTFSTIRKIVRRLRSFRRT